MNEHRVRPGQLAFQRFAIRSVAAFACTGQGGDDAGLQVDLADDVILTIGNEHDLTVAGDCEALRPREAACAQRSETRSERRAAITRIAVVMSAGNACECPPGGIDGIDAVAFPQGQVPFTVSCNL